MADLERFAGGSWDGARDGFRAAARPILSVLTLVLAEVPDILFEALES